MMRINERGYIEILDARSGRWFLEHLLVAENKFGRIPAGFHVHHIDGNKLNNDPSNLHVVHPKVHGRLHFLPNVCLRCGREGHWAKNCYAKTFWDGEPLE